MKREEVKQIIAESRRAYGQLNLPNENELKGMIDVWNEVFEDISYKHAHKAIIDLTRESDKSLTAAQIYKAAKQIARDEYLANGGIIYG